MGRATDDESHSARFQRLFADHQRVVLGYAPRRAQTPTDALDVVVETFLVAWRRSAPLFLFVATEAGATAVQGTNQGIDGREPRRKARP